ncbi:MAG: nucleotidyltransferase domain-containing protein [Bacteroidota bacterium]|nr:nucleotidyltransferase domain-containing protein [Bacteroidota bacterium]
MLHQNEILSTIKATVTKEVPDSTVYLFGSRAANTSHEESDWDILILTKAKYPKSLKWSIHDKLFPLSLSIGSVFSFVLATYDEWENHPAYYSLQKGIGDQYLLL